MPNLYVDCVLPISYDKHYIIMCVSWVDTMKTYNITTTLTSGYIACSSIKTNDTPESIEKYILESDVVESTIVQEAVQ